MSHLVISSICLTPTCVHHPPSHSLQRRYTHPLYTRCILVPTLVAFNQECPVDKASFTLPYLLIQSWKTRPWPRSDAIRSAEITSGSTAIEIQSDPVLLPTLNSARRILDQGASSSVATLSSTPAPNSATYTVLAKSTIHSIRGKIFFFVRLSATKSGKSVFVLFQGMDIVAWFPWIRVLKTIALSQLKAVKLFAGRENERVVLLFQPNVSTIEFLDVEAESPTQSSQPSTSSSGANLLSYQGTITMILDPDLRIICLDDAYVAYMPHLHDSYWRFLQAGCVVDVKNVHVMMCDDEKPCFVFCDYSSLDMRSFSSTDQEMVMSGDVSQQDINTSTGSGGLDRKFSPLSAIRLRRAKTMLTSRFGSLLPSKASMNAFMNKFLQVWTENISSTCSNDPYQEFFCHETACKLHTAADMGMIPSAPSDIMQAIDESMKPLESKFDGSAPVMQHLSSEDLGFASMVGFVTSNDRGDLIILDDRREIKVVSTGSAPLTSRDLDCFWMLSANAYSIVGEIMDISKKKVSGILRRSYLRIDFAEGVKFLSSKKSVVVAESQELVLFLSKIITSTTVRRVGKSKESRLRTLLFGTRCELNALGKNQWLHLKEQCAVVVELGASAMRMLPLLSEGNFYLFLCQYQIQTKTRDTQQILLETLDDVRWLPTQDDALPGNLFLPQQENVRSLLECFQKGNRMLNVQNILRSSQPRSTEDTPSSSTAMLLLGGYLPSLVNFCGIIKNIQYRQTDATYYPCNHGHFRRDQLGSGKAGRIIWLQLGESSTSEVLDFYLDVTKSKFPCGLLVGSCVAIKGACLKVSKEGRVHAVSCGWTRVAPWYPLSEADHENYANAARLDHATTAILPQAEAPLLLHKPSYCQLHDMVDSSTKNACQVLCKVTFFDEIVLRWICENCGNTLLYSLDTCPNRCRTRIGDSCYRFYAKVLCHVTDNTAEAKVIATDAAALRILDLVQEKAVQDLQKLVLQRGDVHLFQCSPWSQQDANQEEFRSEGTWTADSLIQRLLERTSPWLVMTLQHEHLAFCAKLPEELKFCAADAQGWTIRRVRREGQEWKTLAKQRLYLRALGVEPLSVESETRRLLESISI